MVITTIIILGIKTIHAQRHQHLNRQFLVPIACRYRRIDDTIGFLPVHQFIHAFVYQLPRRRTQYIKVFLNVIDDITPPLGTFSVRAIKICITHVKIEGTGRTFPQFIPEGVIAGKTSSNAGIIARLPISYIQHLHSFRNGIFYPVAIHPT